MQIYPSVLDAKPEVSADLLTQAIEVCHFAQLDIADGVYVKNTTAQISEIIPLLKPMSESSVELHLMVEHPDELISDITNLNNLIPVDRILIHMKPARQISPDLNFQHLAELFHYPVGLVLNPSETIPDTIQAFQAVQIMTIEPGFQGTQFMPETLAKITQLRDMGFTGNISLDGGINDATLPVVLEREEWPDAVCPGSYVRENMREKIAELTRIAADAYHQPVSRI